MQSNEQELEALRQEFRAFRRVIIRWKAATTLLVVSVALGAILGFAPQERIVEAHRFVLLAADGTPRAVLGTAGSEAGLLILTPEGAAAATLVATSEVTQLTLQRQGTGRQLLLTVDNEIAQVSEKDALGRTRISLTTSDVEQGSALRLQDGQGTVRAAVGYWPSSGPGMSIMNEAGQVLRALVP